MSVVKSAASILVVWVLAMGMAQAQSLRRSDGPAEVPPASFTASQYIDSRGCVFVRAGYGGQVQWVPRVSRARQQLCGMQPSLAGAAQAAPRASAREPLPTVALTTEPPRIGNAAQARQASAQAQAAATARAAAQAQARQQQVAAANAARAAAQQARQQPARSVQQRQAIVPSAAPVTVVNPAPVRSATVIDITGGPAVIPNGLQTCANRTGLSARYTNTANRNVRCGPQAEDPTGYGSQTVQQATTTTAPKRKTSKRNAAVLRIEGAAPRVPKGYRPVWDDDRLNPHRGLPKGAFIQGALPTGARYIQVGSFGVAANAQRSAARLQALGLPVRFSSVASRSGQSLQVVMAGPFAQADDIRLALATVRRAGFSDAFPR